MAESTCGKKVVTIKDAAALFDVNVVTVRDLIRHNQIQTLPIIHCPAGRGITVAGMAKLRTILPLRRKRKFRFAAQAAAEKNGD
jgi:hypothetical protein